MWRITEKRGRWNIFCNLFNNQEVSFCLRNDLAEILALAEAVELFAGLHKIPDKAVFQINLSLDELLTNSISYGFPEGGEHKIFIRLALREKMLVIEIQDDGIAFNPLEASEVDISQDLEDRRIGGLGIHLTRKMMDQIEYSREEDHNLLVMRKQIWD